MIVNALEHAFLVWAELGESLDDEQWDRPTRLDAWNVKHVYAHFAEFPPLIEAACIGPAAAEPETHATAAELLAFLQRKGGVADSSADHIKQLALDRANEFSTTELVARFTDVAPRAIALLRSADLTSEIDYFGLAVLPQGEALRIPLMEAVVHYFDMAAALDLPVPGPMAGEPVRATVELLSAMADPVALIDAATGRGGPPVFPVMH
jgi:uncharacterized protein (TIGR03083 family)